MLCRRVWLLFPLLFVTGTLQASDIPVFRYALEHWIPEPYDVTIVDAGPPENRDPYILALKSFDRSSRTPYSNYYVQVLDYYMLEVVRLQGIYPGLQTGLADPTVSGVLSEFSSMAFNAKVADASPTSAFMAVRAPRIAADGQPIWITPVDPLATRMFAISPARAELARRLLSGESIVWLLLESGNRDADDRATVLLDVELSRLEKELKLPGGIGEPGSKLRLELPLQIKFSMIRLRRDDLYEQFLITNLLTSDANVQKAMAARKPVAIPVFGRGRCLSGLFGENLTSEGISKVAGELVASCKEENVSDHPGFDLMLVADWDALAQNRPIEPLLGSLLDDFVYRYFRSMTAAQIANLAMPTFGSSIWFTYALVRDAIKPVERWEPETLPQLHRPGDGRGQTLASEGDRSDNVEKVLQSRDARLIALGVVGGLVLLCAGFMYLARRGKRVAQG